jgi:hypothetical protein
MVRNPRAAMPSALALALAVSVAVLGLGPGVTSASAYASTRHPARLVPPPTTALAKPPPPRPVHNFTIGPDSVGLISQPAWLGPQSSVLQLDLAVEASKPSEETLAVTVYGSLLGRSQFQAAVAGNVFNAVYEGPGPGGASVPVDDLANASSGGVAVDIPVNSPSGGLAFTTTGVYPVQVFLEEDGARVGQPLTTFIVYAGKDASTLVHLETAVVVPLGAKLEIGSTGTPAPVPSQYQTEIGADVAQIELAAQAGAGRSPGVPVTVRADVPTLESLSSQGKQARSIVTGLAQALSAGDELLPATALPIDLPGFVSSGLTADLQAELSGGGAELRALVGVDPSWRTWVFLGSAGTPALSALAQLGAAQVVVPDADLSALPSADGTLTFSLPTKLSLSGRDVAVMGADTELSARTEEASSTSQTALVANQVLAEMAMVDLEAPGRLRGLVLAPPPGALLAPGFLAVVLDGLRDNPLLKPVTVAQLFHDVPLATVDGRAMQRQLVGAQAAQALGGTGQLGAARAAVSAAAEVYGQRSPLITALTTDVDVSLSAAFSSAQRSTVIATALRTAQSDLAEVKLPPGTSITLTSRQGRLPLTVLSGAGVPVRVRLTLFSEQLGFLVAHFGSEGSCSPVNAGAEQCVLVLSRPTTLLQVPVDVRTSGAFPLSLTVSTPSGSEALSEVTDTVRSTAVSDVGLVLMVSAALFLVVWWARNARHGRRARRLVPRPPDDEGVEPGLATMPPPGSSLARAGL